MAKREVRNVTVSITEYGNGSKDVGILWFIRTETETENKQSPCQNYTISPRRVARALEAQRLMLAKIEAGPK